MKIEFFGTRGTIPVSGEDFRQYGGDTTCVLIEVNERTVVIIDSGTGIHKVSGKYKEIHIFITHLHWDHIMGLPLFGSVYDSSPDKTIYIYHQSKETVPSLLNTMFQRPYFPVIVEQLQSNIYEQTLEPGSVVNINSELSIVAYEGNHPDGVLMYKIFGKHSSLVFTGDYEHGNEVVEKRLIEIARNVDVLVYDAAYTPEEYNKFFKGWGHSHYLEAIKVAQESNCKQLILTHHSQKHNDEILNKIREEVEKLHVGATLAYDGMKIEVL